MKKYSYAFYLLLIASSAHAQSGTGIGTTAPNSTLDVRGGMATVVRTTTGSTTLTITDHILVFTGTSNSTVTLPDATTCKGRIYWVKNANTTTVPVLTVNTSLSQTIEGAPSSDLDEPNEVLRVISDGNNWVISTQTVPTAKSATTGGAWNQGGNALKSLKSIGTLSSPDLPVITNNNEAMRINAAGFVGIGTNNPQGRIHVVNDNDNAGDDYSFGDCMNGANGITQGFTERKSSGTFASPGNLSTDDMIGQFRFAPRFGGSLVRSNGSGLDAVYKGDGTTALTDLRLFSSGTEKLHINENGKVSIGTSVPDGINPEKLLVDAGNTGSYNVISGKGEIDNYLQLNIQNRSSGNVASSDLVATADNGDENVNYIDMGINSSGYGAGSSPILNTPDQAYLFTTGGDFVIGNSTPSQDLIFFNVGTVGYAATSERMRITSSGNVGIGQIATPSEKLIVGGIMSPATDNTYTLGTSDNRWSAVWASNGVVQTSDANMKTHIGHLNYGTDELMKLRPVRYNWKTDPEGAAKVGLIAQEVKEVIPEVVHGNGSTQKLGMNYSELVSVLINTIQQQQEKIKQLKSELQSLIVQ